jgi:hypothetical protein
MRTVRSSSSSSDRIADAEGTDNSSDLSRRESDLMSSYKLEKRALELTEALSKAPPLATLMGMRVNNLG